MSTLTIQPYRLNLDGSVSATGSAASAIAPQFSEVISDAGAGQVTFKNTNPWLANLAHDGNDLIQFLVDGSPEFVLVPDPEHKVSIAQGEYDEERTTLSGNGLLALLDRMRVYPTGGVGRLPKETDRFWNWTTLDFDDSTWADSKEILLVGYAKLTWPIPWAEDFPLDIALIIWADNPGGNTSDYLSADEGDCWFRYGFTPPEEGVYRCFLTADNSAEVYIDSQLVGSVDTFTSTAQFDFSLSADPHVVAIHAHNGAWLPGLDSGPGGVALAIYEVRLDGLFLVTYTFDGYQVLAYEDDPPGVTPGYALRLFLEEGQTRGVLPGLTWDFDDVDDSNGNPWDVVSDIACPVNNSGLDFLRELAATYMDLAMDPDLSAGLVLHAYRLGEMGVSTGETFARGVNITSLEHDRENVPVNAILGEAADRWIERTDAGSIAAHGRSESGLETGSPASVAEANRILDGQLDIFAHPREQIAAGVKPSPAQVPLLKLGNRFTIPDSTGASDEERLVARTVTETDERAVWTLAFRDVVLGEDERIVRMASA